MKKNQTGKRFPGYGATCFYILTGCAICSALFLYGSSLWKNKAPASSGSIFEVSASGEAEPPKEEPVPLPEDIPADDTAAGDAEHYYAFVTSNVKGNLHVRIQPDMDAEIIARLAPGTAGCVLEQGEEWSLVKTADIAGYVSNRYLQFQEITKEEYFAQTGDVSQ